MDRCLIILSYIENITENFIVSLADNAEYVICADGGQTIARKYGIKPDCVIGDFDSTNTNSRFDCKYIAYPAEKDITDAEASIEHAVKEGLNSIKILGGIGGRIDHTVGNISLLLKFYDKVRNIEFLDMKNSMQIIRNSSIKLFPSEMYKFFSITSIDEIACGVTISGAKYPVCNITLERAGTLGISNEIIISKNIKNNHSDCAEITVENGTLLVMRSSDRS